jgi:hypothetical protein
MAVPDIIDIQDAGRIPAWLSLVAHTEVQLLDATAVHAGRSDVAEWNLPLRPGARRHSSDGRVSYRLLVADAILNGDVERVDSIAARLSAADGCRLPLAGHVARRGDLGELGPRHGSVSVATHGQADVYGRRHRHSREGRVCGWLRSQIDPSLAISRVLDSEHGAGARQLHPVWQHDGARRHVRGSIWVAHVGSRARTPLHANAQAGCDDTVHQPGVRTECLADHHASLSPFVRVVDAVDPGNDGAVAGELFVDEAELISRIPDVGPGTVHDDVAVGDGVEARRVASIIQRQRVGPIGRPVLGQGERQHGLGVGDAIRVMVVERHGLPIARDGLFRVGRVLMADQCAIVIDVVPIEPNVEDPVALVVAVALEIVDDDVLLCGEAPDIPVPDTGAPGVVDLIDLPKVARAQV